MDGRDIVHTPTRTNSTTRLPIRLIRWVFKGLYNYRPIEIQFEFCTKEAEKSI